MGDSSSALQFPSLLPWKGFLLFIVIFLLLTQFRLGLICFNRHHWFTIVVGTILWVVCVFCAILGVMFWDQEKGMFTGEASSTQTVNVVKVQQNAQKV